jgi:DNA polymerase
MTDLFYGTSGPRDAKIMLVGEAWGETEEWEKTSFVGGSGQELNRMLAEVGIAREACFATNVIAARPPSNNLWKWLGSEKEKNFPEFMGLRPSPAVVEGVHRLWEQIRTVKPELVIAVGNWAFWALSSEVRIRKGDKSAGEDSTIHVPSGIMNFRGSMLYTRKEIGNFRLLPIIHPAAIMRSWELREPTIHDLRYRIPKALRGDWEHTVTINHLPRFNEVVDFLSSKLTLLNSGQSVKLAHDIETLGPVLTCMGFADSSTNAIVIPFIKKENEGFASHWPLREEVILTRLICAVLSHPRAQIIGQYYHYDSTYMAKLYGIVPPLFHDTHGAQHLLFPGTSKDLGYLSSLYCGYHRYWKDDNKEWNTKDTLAHHFYYNGEDCIRTFEIHEHQLSVIAVKHLDHLWHQTLARHHIALEMSLRGIRINMQMKAQLALDLSYESQLRIQWLLKIVPQSLIDEWNGGPTFRKKPGQAKTQVFWPNSTSQQKVLFYDILQFASHRHRKTKQASLDKEAIPKLAARYPFAKRIFDTLLELRSIAVFSGTFVNARCDADQRMRTSFNAAGTETFRWSSSINPFGTGGNFQNLPSGKEI